MIKQIALLLAFLSCTTAFSVQPRAFSASPSKISSPAVLFMATESKEEGIVELSDEDTEVKAEQKLVAPFLSQGEIDPKALSPDLSEAKEARVILYMIISLLPVLFLIPLMLGSRDMIPADWLPPVEMSN